MLLDVDGGQLAPPVATDSVRRPTCQRTRPICRTRVDGADRNALPRLLDGEAQVTVIGNDDDSIDGSLENIEKQVRRNVDV
jgi:hypothetical protein